MGAVPGLPEITEVKRLAIKPGDRLIVRLDHEPSQYEAHEMLSRLHALLGADVPVIVLAPGMDIEVLEGTPGERT